MKLFKSVRKFYETIGIYPLQSINYRNAFCLISQIPITISLAGYFLFKASTTIEHTQTFYILLFHIACSLNLVISFFKKREIFETMEKADELFQKSKFKD